MHVVPRKKRRELEDPMRGNVRREVPSLSLSLCARRILKTGRDDVHSWLSSLYLPTQVFLEQEYISMSVCCMLVSYKSAKCRAKVSYKTVTKKSVAPHC